MYVPSHIVWISQFQRLRAQEEITVNLLADLDRDVVKEKLCWKLVHDAVDLQGCNSCLGLERRKDEIPLEGDTFFIRDRRAENSFSTRRNLLINAGLLVLASLLCRVEESLERDQRQN